MPHVLVGTIEVDRMTIEVRRTHDGIRVINPKETAPTARGSSEQELLCTMLESMEKSSERTETLIHALMRIADSGAFPSNFGGDDVKRMAMMMSAENFSITQGCRAYRAMLSRGPLMTLVDGAV